MKAQVQIIIALLVTVAISVALTFATSHYIKLRDAAAQGELDKGKLETTTGVIADSDEADEDRDRTDAVVSDARGTYNTRIEEAERNEPQTRNRADRAVPDSVRRAYRERRLARERLGRDEVGDEAGAGSQDAPER